MRRSLALFLILASACALTLGGHLYSPDEEILFRMTEGIARGASPAVEPIRDPMTGDGFATRPSPRRDDGLEYAQYGLGQPLAAVPFYWFGRALGSVVDPGAWAALRGRMPTDHPAGAGLRDLDALGRETAARFGVSLFNLAITALTGTLLYRFLRLLLDASGVEKPDAPAWLAALAWGLGSMAWPHARTFFTEPLAGLCLVAALHALAHATLRATPRASLWALAAGLAAGYACLVRLDSILLLPGLALVAFFGGLAPNETDAPRSWRTTLHAAAGEAGALRRVVLFALPVAGIGALLGGINLYLFGDLTPAYSDQPEGIAFSTPLLAGAYGFLFSVGKGLFFFSPALAPGVLGLKPLFRRRPGFALGLAAVFLVFFLAMCKWRNWAGGWCWGPRHVMQIHALLAAPLAFWLARGLTPVRRGVLTASLLVGAAVQVYGCSQSFIAYYRVFYQDPAPPSAHLMYDTQTNAYLASRFLVLRREPGRAEPAPVSPAALPAPVNDSIYVLQNSQWTGYAALWRERGMHDFFWLHVFGAGR